jgi:hypothetical protein
MLMLLPESNIPSNGCGTVPMTEAVSELKFVEYRNSLSGVNRI